MLAAALDECRAIGLQRIRLCCAPGNEPFRRVIVANVDSEQWLYSLAPSADAQSPLSAYSAQTASSSTSASSGDTETSDAPTTRLPAGRRRRRPVTPAAEADTTSVLPRSPRRALAPTTGPDPLRRDRARPRRTTSTPRHPARPAQWQPPANDREIPVRIVARGTAPRSRSRRVRPPTTPHTSAPRREARSRIAPDAEGHQ
jgi:hypothetical protein